MVIGPMLENSLRQSLLISGGNLGSVFFRPISLAIYLVTAVIFVAPWILKRASNLLDTK